MRILHVVHAFPPESQGGTQQYVHDLARLQQQAGHEVAVIAGARDGGGMVQHREQDGMPVWRVHRLLPQEALSGDLGSDRIGQQVEALATAFAPDLAHVHHWQNLSNDLVQRLAARGLTVVLTLHDLFVGCARSFRMPDQHSLCDDGMTLDDCAHCLQPDLPQLGAELPRLLAARQANFERELAAAGAVLTVSEAQQRKLAATGCAATLRTVPIGILAGAPLPAPVPLPGRLRLCNWAGLDPRKGLPVLLAAIAGSAEAAQFELHVHGHAGEAPFMQQLRQLAHGLDVHWHGEFAAGAHWQFGGRYDLAVFPSLAFETHGLMVDEALQAGLPVLCSDLGAPPQRLGGRGLTFPAGDAAALRTLLERLLAAPERLQQMRRAPHGATDLQTHHRRLLQLYGELTGRMPRVGDGR